MKKRKILQTAALSILLTSTITAGVSFAWFYTTANIGGNQGEANALPIIGSSKSAYFAYGKGTSSSPYGIKTPRHLYNLAWLQYLGYFNDEQLYFELADSVDMDGWTLPPIGTEEHPFIGNFNGKGYVVSNLNVSNSFSDYNVHPGVVTEDDFTSPHILGFFGVIGDYNGDTTDYSSAINTFVDTGLYDITVTTHTANTLMGIAAGYVDCLSSDDSVADGGMRNILVDSSKLDIDSSLANTTSFGSHTDNISDYSLVGYTTSATSIKKASKKLYGVNVDTNATFNATEDGSSNGWGGSLNMLNIYDRIVNIADSTTYSTNRTSYTWKYEHIIKPNGRPNVDGEDTISSANDTMNTSDANLKTFNHSNGNYYKAGNYMVTRRLSNNVKNYNYLQGGTYNVYNYQKYFHHSGYRITIDGENYLTCSNITNNASLSSSEESEAIVWSIPNGDTGRIYTYFNYTNYYLSVNGTSLRLVNSTTNATTWTIDTDVNGKIRYTYNGYYLNFVNGQWVMTPLPAEPTSPTVPNAPTAPTPVSEPNQADYEAQKITAPADADSTYQISYTSNGTTYYLSVEESYYETNYTTTTSIFTTGWDISSLSNNSTATIRIHGTTDYLRPGNNSMSIDNARNWNVTTDGTTYQFYYVRSNGNRYLRFSGTSFTYGTGAGGRNLTVMTTAQAVNNYNAAIDASYAAAMAEYSEYLDNYAQYQIDYQSYLDNEYAQYLDDYAQYEVDHANWVTTMDNLHPITVKIGEIDGPDIDRNYAKTEYGMEYTSTNTTFFPLNVVKDDEKTHTATTNNISDYYPKETNTGYVTIGSNFDNSTTRLTKDTSNMRVSRYDASRNADVSNIENSFYSGQTSLSNVKTIDTNNSVVNIDNTIAQQYEKYADSKAAFENILTSSAAQSGNTRYIYGLHFMPSSISMDHLLKADWVSIGGKEYTNYDLPVDAIDFNLKEAGYINFFAGTYFTDSVTSFFSLHKIVRSSDNSISNIFEIEEIYKDTSTSAMNHSYVYKLKDQSGNITYSCPYVFDASGKKTTLVTGKDPDANNLSYNELPAGYVSSTSLVFRTSQIKIHNNLPQEYAFYFEIPMNAGEYCLGSVEGGIGGYLMYLDIGANAAKTNRTIFYEHYSLDENTYSFPNGVALVDLDATVQEGQEPKPVNQIPVGTVDYSDSACVVIEPSSTGSVLIDRKDSSSANSVALTRSQTINAPPVYQGDNIDSIYDSSAPSTALEVTPAVSLTKNVTRMTYYDYVVNADSLLVTTFTDTITKDNNDPDAASITTRTIVQSTYTGNTVSDTPSSTYTYDSTQSYTTANDPRNSMKIYNTTNGVRYSNAEFTSLVIPTSKISDTLTLEISIQQDGGDGFDDVTTLVVALDSSYGSVNYKFDSYSIVITPDSGTINVKVITYSASITVKVTNLGVTPNTTSNVTFTNVITINGTTVTGSGQEIGQP